MSDSSRQSSSSQTDLFGSALKSGAGWVWDNKEKAASAASSTASAAWKHRDSVASGAKTAYENRETIAKGATYANEHRETVAWGVQVASDHPELAQGTAQFARDNPETFHSMASVATDNPDGLTAAVSLYGLQDQGKQGSSQSGSQGSQSGYQSSGGYQNGSQSGYRSGSQSGYQNGSHSQSGYQNGSQSTPQSQNGIQSGYQGWYQPPSNEQTSGQSSSDPKSGQTSQLFGSLTLNETEQTTVKEPETYSYFSPPTFSDSSSSLESYVSPSSYSSSSSSIPAYSSEGSSYSSPDPSSTSYLSSTQLSSPSPSSSLQPNYSSDQPPSASSNYMTKEIPPPMPTTPSPGPSSTSSTSSLFSPLSVLSSPIPTKSVPTPPTSNFSPSPQSSSSYSTTPSPSNSTTPNPSYSTTPSPSNSTTPSPSYSTAPNPSYSTTPNPSQSTIPNPSYSTSSNPSYSASDPSYSATLSDPSYSTTSTPADSTSNLAFTSSNSLFPNSHQTHSFGVLSEQPPPNPTSQYSDVPSPYSPTFNQPNSQTPSSFNYGQSQTTATPSSPFEQPPNTFTAATAPSAPYLEQFPQSGAQFPPQPQLSSQPQFPPQPQYPQPQRQPSTQPDNRYGNSSFSQSHPPPPDLLCKICRNLFSSPVSLLCFHTFCAGCVAKLQQTIHFQPFNCPVCNTLCDLEPAFLPKNLDIGKKVEDYQRGKPSPSLPPLKVDSSSQIPQPVTPSASISSSPSSFSSDLFPPASKGKIPIVGTYAHFILSEQQASNEILKWIEARWFAPSRFSTRVRLSPLRQLYVPFYIFSFRTSSQYFAEALVVDLAKPLEKEWEKVSGRQEQAQSGVLVSSAVQDEAKEIVSQFQTEDWESAFANQPLSSFPQDIAFEETREWMDVWLEYSAKVKAQEKEIAKATLDTKGWKLRDLKVLTTFEDLERRLIYLPLYTGFYIFESSEYKVIVNGQKGSVTGMRPYGLGSSVEIAKNAGQKASAYLESWRRG